MDKEKKKVIRRWFGRVLLNVSSALVKVFPFRFILAMGRGFGSLAYFFAGGLRKTALDNLRIAFSEEKSPRQIKEIARDSFRFMGEAGWEMFYFLNNLKAVRECVEIRGLCNLKKALEKKRGVIAVTAHFGDFPLMCLRLKEEGFIVNTMMRPMRDEKAGDFFYKLRTDAGVKTIFSYPRREAVFGSLKALDNNEIIVIQMDQNFGTGGVWVKFFDRLAATPVGPIVLGSRSGACLVPMFIVRKDEGRHSVFIEEEVPLDTRPDKDEAILVNAIKFTRIIESWIRKYPSLWGWIHRRWKSRPNQKAYNLKYKVQKF
ncbi:MAG: lysophospholipid acyltransferase family protein [Candidatus Omnitrophica bacterium]|nr:lysophospholipid acyltransferase family protein [Candidatus Omnitrophota bacterium]